MNFSIDRIEFEELPHNNKGYELELCAFVNFSIFYKGYATAFSDKVYSTGSIEKFPRCSGVSFVMVNHGSVVWDVVSMLDLTRGRLNEEDRCFIANAVDAMHSVIVRKFLKIGHE